MSQPATLAFLANHELRLGWRDWVSMMTAGHRRRLRSVAIALIVFACFMHLLAYSMVGRYAATGLLPDKATLVVVTGTMLLSWSLLVVAGDGVGHPRLLCALRSRSDSDFAG